VDSQRTQAYRRVISTLEDIGPTKLQHEEQERIRDAADTLIFSSGLADDAAREALDDTRRLCQALVDSGRWEQATAGRLASDIRDCGPSSAPGREAA
jgi:hypothetical protein